MGAGGQQPPKAAERLGLHAAPERNGPKLPRLTAVLPEGSRPQRELLALPPGIRQRTKMPCRAKERRTEARSGRKVG
jgi:hypothetical protein